MSEVCLGLPNLNLILDSKALQLSVSATVKLNSFDRNLICLQSEGWLEAILSGSAWTRRGRGSHLDFRIEHNGKSLDAEIDSGLIQLLGILIQDAPFWSELGLCPTLRSDPSHFDSLSSSSFVIDLRHELSSLDSKGDEPNSFISDIKPPDGIMLADFEKVTLVMSFSDTFSRSMGSASHQTIQSGDGLLFTEGLSENMFLQDHWVTAQSLLYNIKPLSSPSGSQQPMNHSEKYDQAADTRPVVFDVASAHTLMEAALRQVIGGRQSKRSPNIRIEKPYPRMALCDICPSMWSPGFLQKMTSRVPLIPKIGNVFRTSIMENAQSPSLRDKLGSFKNLHQQSTRGAIDRNSTDGAPAAKPAEAQIFKLTKLNIYDPASARRLATSAILDVEKIARQEDLDISESIYQGHATEDGSSFDGFTEFEDLFEEERDQLDMPDIDRDYINHVEDNSSCIYGGFTPDIQTGSFDKWEDEEMCHDLTEGEEMLI